MSDKSCHISALYPGLPCFAVLVTIYVRFRQIAELYHNHSSASNIVRLNRVGLIVGSVAALGISITANFQETNVFYVHIFGALTAFGLGTAYLWVQVRQLCLSIFLIPLMPSSFQGEITANVSPLYYVPTQFLTQFEVCEGIFF